MLSLSNRIQLHTMSKTSTVAPSKTLSSTEPAPQNAKYLSVSCQQVISEDFTGSSAKVIVRSTLADPLIYPAVCGHKCNDVGLFPSSLNADMAVVAAEHIYKTLRPDAEVPGINVCHMDVEKPLITQMPQQGLGQHIEMEIKVTLNGNLGDGKCVWHAVKPDGTKLERHAHCTIRFEDRATWAQEWAGSYGHIMLRINDLINRSVDPLGSLSVKRMDRPEAYQLFKSFVDYSETYQNMSEVIFDGLEGTAAIDFQTTKADYCAPYHYDGSCHLSGFLCNAYDRDRDGFAYVSHGWDCGKMSRAFQPGEKLRNYVHMRQEPKDVLAGDVYILSDEGDDAEIVGVWEGIKFKRIPRRVLNFFLPKPKKN